FPGCGVRQLPMPEPPESPLIFDRLLLRARRRRALAAGVETFLLARVAADLAERLTAVLRRFDLALDLGTPGGALRAALAGIPSVGTVISARAAFPENEGIPAPFVVADEEALPFGAAAFDLVVSAL